jgi:hypothetical protein
MAELKSKNIEIRYAKGTSADKITFIREGIIKFCARHGADASIVDKPEASSTEVFNDETDLNT